MLSLLRRLGVSVAVGSLLVGCQPPARLPSPVPSYRCTPEAGGPEFDCSQRQHDDMVAKDKLYAEAEAVYRRFLAEEVRLLRSGGATRPSQVLRDTASGAFLEGVMSDLTEARSNGVAVDKGERVVRRTERLSGLSKGGSQIAIAFCVDSSTVHFTRHGRDAGFGDVTRDEVYFGGVEGRLKAIGADGEVVREC